MNAQATSINAHGIADAVTMDAMQVLHAVHMAHFRKRKHEENVKRVTDEMPDGAAPSPAAPFTTLLR